MRRNIFDILEEEMNLEYEIETIVNLFNEATVTKLMQRKRQIK